jgi:hypothetical protein
MNVPEYSQSRRLDAGRIDPDKMIAATNAALSAKFGEGEYITAWWNPTLYVDYRLIEDRKLNKIEVENAAQAFLRQYPGVEAVFTRTQMEQGMMPNTKLAKQVILAWHQQISGDIVVMNKPNWYLFAKPSTYASTHGSPWSYDTNVPPSDVWAELDQTWQIRRLRSRRPRAHDRLHPERAAAEWLRGTRPLRGFELSSPSLAKARCQLRKSCRFSSSTALRISPTDAKHVVLR